MGSVDLEISAWSDGSSFASVVKGKVRTIEMRSPVPPAPMCPKETRVQSTWHVVILEDKVLLESVSMSLDVPCGTNFNVIACDTFSVQDGKLKMVRTCGIEWLQSTWLKSMIEQNVPPQLAAVGERMAKVVGRWWQKAGSSQNDGSASLTLVFLCPLPTSAEIHIVKCRYEVSAQQSTAIWKEKSPPPLPCGGVLTTKVTRTRVDPTSVCPLCPAPSMLAAWACWPLLAAVGTGGMGGDAVAEALLGGRSAFVRFYAPWCGHSQAMQPAWQQLAKAYQSSGDILISDIDCTVPDNEDRRPIMLQVPKDTELCRNQSIESYPTLKYFNAETGHAGRTYADARDYESLRRVAERAMMRCVPSTKQDCDARQKTYIDRMQGAGAAAREQELRRLLRLSEPEPEASAARRAWLSNRIALLQGLGGESVTCLNREKNNSGRGGAMSKPEALIVTRRTWQNGRFHSVKLFRFTEITEVCRTGKVPGISLSESFDQVLASGIEEVTIEFTDVLSGAALRKEPSDQLCIL
eukprot:s994_g6.t1